MTLIVGWASSLLLLATLIAQVRGAWKRPRAAASSWWLFLGQLLASAGFTAYSALLRDWVFVVTNGLLTVNALVGMAISAGRLRARLRALRMHGRRRHPSSQPSRLSR